MDEWDKWETTKTIAALHKISQGQRRETPSYKRNQKRKKEKEKGLEFLLSQSTWKEVYMVSVISFN